jgi:pentatricopeptide repeat protein
VCVCVCVYVYVLKNFQTPPKATYGCDSVKFDKGSKANKPPFYYVSACCLAGEWERGAGLLQRMEAAGHTAGEETYLGVLQALEKVCMCVCVNERGAGLCW